MKPAKWIDIGAMDELSRMDTYVHRLDARAKAIVTVAFVVVVTSFHKHEVSALTPFLLYPIATMVMGRIPVLPIFRKILLALPFAFVVAIFNPLLDRQPIAVVGPITITGGWLSFASIILRCLLTVGAALVLVACTGMFRLCAGLQKMGVPRLFVLQLLFFYRYLSVLAGEGSRMVRSIEIRSVRPARQPLSVYASLVGHLLLRAIDRAERIYQAMVSRGFDGTIRLQDSLGFRGRDLVFMAGWLLFFAAARTWNIAETIGRYTLELTR
jgi:cobalt/nickel transport system permease protein